MTIFNHTSLSEEELLDLIPLYFKEIKTDYIALNEFCRSNDFDQAQLIAHKMKGTSKSYGVAVIVQILESIEDALKHQQKNTLVAEIQLLAKTIERISSEIKSLYNIDLAD